MPWRRSWPTAVSCRSKYWSEPTSAAAQTKPSACGPRGCAVAAVSLPSCCRAAGSPALIVIVTVSRVASLDKVLNNQLLASITAREGGVAPRPPPAGAKVRNYDDAVHSRQRLMRCQGVSGVSRGIVVCLLCLVAATQPPPWRRPPSRIVRWEEGSVSKVGCGGRSAVCAGCHAGSGHVVK